MLNTKAKETDPELKIFRREHLVEDEGGDEKWFDAPEYIASNDAVNQILNEGVSDNVQHKKNEIDLMGENNWGDDDIIDIEPEEEHIVDDAKEEDLFENTSEIFVPPS